MTLNKDFKEFVGLLNEFKVSYLVVGGYAVNYHGYPRYTKDLDFWILPSEDNLQALMKVLKEFGFGSLGLSPEDFMNPGNVIELGYEPCRIDMLTDLGGGLSFWECHAARSEFVFEGIPISFIGVKRLIDAKRIAGRAQDLADADALEKISGTKP